MLREKKEPEKEIEGCGTGGGGLIYLNNLVVMKAARPRWRLGDKVSEEKRYEEKR